jgi:hypothetical protein
MDGVPTPAMDNCIPHSGALHDQQGPLTLGSAALSGVAGKVVQTLRPHTESDPAALLLTFLAAFGNAVGPGPHVLADGAQHPARLFVVVVGKSSRSRKGTSWRNIRNVMESADESWATLCVTSGLSSGEGLIEAASHVQGENSLEPERRLFVVEEEFSRTLAVKDRKDSTLSEVCRDAWDNGNLRVLTKNPREALNTHISLLAHITVRELRETLTSIDMANGFGNRFLWCHAQRSQSLASGGNLQESQLLSVASEIRQAVLAGRQQTRIRRSGEAEADWTEWYDTEALEDGEEDLSDCLLARSEAQVLRLSLIYALLDSSPQIERKHLKAALEVWDYCRRSVQHIFVDQTGDPVADRLLAELERNPGGLDRTRQSNLFSRHENNMRLHKARKLLIETGRAVEKSVPTNGPPRHVLFLANHAK